MIGNMKFEFLKSDIQECNSEKLHIFRNTVKKPTYGFKMQKKQINYQLGGAMLLVLAAFTTFKIKGDVHEF